MTPLIVAIGELLIDFTPVVEEGHTVGFRLHPGGSPYNVAIALARMDLGVEFAGTASRDLFGRVLVDHLRDEGVGTRFLGRSAAPSTLAFVGLEGGEPSFAFYGDRTADTLLQPDDLAGIAADMLHCGSISLLREPGATAIVGLVERLRGRALVSLDPNIRPSLVTDPAGYRQTLARTVQAVDIVKMSEADARWLAPERATDAVAAEVLAQGPALVVVTQGARGAFARTATTHAQVAAPRVRVVDTVGAGDAFTAGLLCTLVQRDAVTRAAVARLGAEDLQAVLRFAAAAAALTCTHEGADPPRRREIDEFLARG